ncbi:FMP42, partial [Symbiodinium pilosum]
KIAETEGTLDSLDWINTLTGFVIPFGFVAVPLIELSMHRLGTMWTVQLTTLIGVVYNVLQLVPSLHVQLVTVVLFAAWRAFLYSTISAFNGEIFGVKTMGRIMGLCFVFSGLTNMLTGPLVNSAVDSDNFTQLLIEGVAITIPLPVLFFILQRRRSQRSEARAPLTDVEPSPPVSRTNSRRKSLVIDPLGGMSITRARSAQAFDDNMEEQDGAGLANGGGASMQPF